jgi:predicted AlkP superfamily phosphohydrolase/phosphomutase
MTAGILRKSILICILMVTLLSKSYSQEVEHNYKVGPQATTCDSLSLERLSETEAIEQIRLTKFRFQQSFRLTRRMGFKGGEFYSCDNINGYLLLKYNDEEQLYVNVKKEYWENLKISSDPEGFYLDSKGGLNLYHQKQP